MRTCFRAATGLLSLILLLALCPFTVAAAANATVAFSANPLTVGDTLTVTVNFTADSIGAVDAQVTYNSSVLEFVSGNDASGSDGVIRLAGYATAAGTASQRFTLTFKAIASGSSTVKVGSSTVYTWDETLAGNPTAGATVTVQNAALSQNADLKSLKLSTGRLSPSFSASVTTYTATVAYNVTSLTVTAVAADSGAQVQIEGNSALAVGNNVRRVIVTSPGGATKTYTVTVIRQSEPEPTTAPTTTAPITVEHDGVSYRADTVPKEQMPTGFRDSTAVFREQTVPAARNEGDTLCLLYLLDADDNGTLYLYDEADGTLCPFVPLTVGGSTLYLIDPDTPPTGLSAATRTVGEAERTVWLFARAERADFYVVYAKGADGVDGWYCVDTVQNTVQRYVPGAVETTAPATTTAPTAAPTAAAAQTQQSRWIQWLPWGIAALLLLVCVALGILLILARRDTDGELISPPRHGAPPRH